MLKSTRASLNGQAKARAGRREDKHLEGRKRRKWNKKEERSKVDPPLKTTQNFPKAKVAAQLLEGQKKRKKNPLFTKTSLCHKRRIFIHKINADSSWRQTEKLAWIGLLLQLLGNFLRSSAHSLTSEDSEQRTKFKGINKCQNLS